jgi:hypothetical protein
VQTGVPSLGPEALLDLAVQMRERLREGRSDLRPAYMGLLLNRVE